MKNRKEMEENEKMMREREREDNETEKVSKNMSWNK